MPIRATNSREQLRPVPMTLARMGSGLRMRPSHYYRQTHYDGTRTGKNFALDRQTEPLVMPSEISGMDDLRAYLKYGNYVARFSFPFIELHAKHKAFIEREMDDFLPRSFDPRDVIPEEETLSRGWENPEQAAIDFNAENL